MQLTSTGLRELDVLLTGGGQALYSCILLVKEERFTDLTEVIARYWVAQGLSHGHCVMLIPTDSFDGYGNDAYYGGASRDELKNSFLSSLPMNMHFKNLAKKMENVNIDRSMHDDNAIIEEENSDQEDEEAEKGLKIAWQYKREIQNERKRISPSASSKSAQISSHFCHSFDLGKSIQTDLFEIVDNENRTMDSVSKSEMENSTKAIVNIPPPSIFENADNPLKLFANIIRYIKESLCTSLQKDVVIRVLLLDIDPKTYAVVIPLLSSTVRSMQLPVCFMATIKSGFWNNNKYTSSYLQLKRTCEVVLTVDSFEGYVSSAKPAEFRDLVGLLEIDKLSGQHFGHFADKFAPANKYGLKRDRRKLHIQMLHLPPEDFAEGGSSVGSGVRSGGGISKKEKSKSTDSSTCGSSTSKTSLLDF